MARSTPRSGADWLARNACGPSHSTQTHRRRSAGPATTASPATAPSHPGYVPANTGDRQILVLRRADIGSVPPSEGSVPQHAYLEHWGQRNATVVKPRNETFRSSGNR